MTDTTVTTTRRSPREIFIDARDSAAGAGTGIVIGTAVLFYVIGWLVERAFLAASSLGYTLDPWPWLVAHVVLGVLAIVAIAMAARTPPDVLDTPESRRLSRIVLFGAILLFFLPWLIGLATSANAEEAVDQAASAINDMVDDSDIVALSGDVLENGACEDGVTEGEPNFFVRMDGKEHKNAIGLPLPMGDANELVPHEYGAAGRTCEDPSLAAHHNVAFGDVIPQDDLPTAVDEWTGEFAANSELWARKNGLVADQFMVAGGPEYICVSEVPGDRDGLVSILAMDPNDDAEFPRSVQFQWEYESLLAELGADDCLGLWAFPLTDGRSAGFGPRFLVARTSWWILPEGDFGPSVSQVETESLGLGQAETDDTTPSPDETVPESTEDTTPETSDDTTPSDEQDQQDTGGDTGDTEGPGDQEDEGTTGEPGEGGECDGGCPGDDDGPGGGGEDECPDGCPKKSTTTTTHAKTTTTTKAPPKTTTTTAPPKTTTTTAPPKTTTTTAPPKTTTTTKATTTTSKPTTTTTTTPKGTAPCSPFDPMCDDSGGSSAQAPSTVVMGMEIPVSPEQLPAVVVSMLALLSASILIAKASRTKEDGF